MNANKIDISYTYQDQFVDLKNFSECFYNGNEIKPSLYIIVKKRNQQLIENVDYTVSYENNIDSFDFSKKYAKMIIKGKGVYQGTIIKEFKINRLPLKSAMYNMSENYFPPNFVFYDMIRGTGNKPFIPWKIKEPEINIDYKVDLDNIKYDVIEFSDKYGEEHIGVRISGKVKLIGLKNLIGDMIIDIEKFEENVLVKENGKWVDDKYRLINYDYLNKKLNGRLDQLKK